MPHAAGKKEDSRARILESAARGFRAQGFSGLGVDGIAKAAGVTSGAFYAHFPSKAAAFREAVAVGMADLREGIKRFRQTAGAKWRRAFIDFYLGDRRTCDIGKSCALQALSGEVARGDAATQADYKAELQRILDVMTASDGDGEPSMRRGQAIALLALLSGGVSIARAVSDPALSEEIATALRSAADRIETSKPV